MYADGQDEDEERGDTRQDGVAVDPQRADCQFVTRPISSDAVNAETVALSMSSSSALGAPSYRATWAARAARHRVINSASLKATRF